MKCMQTNFGVCDLFGFRVMAPFCLPSKTAKISLRTMDYSPWGSKIRISSEKFMQLEVDVKCMQTNFSGHGTFSFGDFAPF